MKKPFLYTPTPAASRVFLVLLRLAIGWHLFIEGASKLETFAVGPTGASKPFSSRGYLLQSQGPLSPFFRQIAGDPDIAFSQLLESKNGEIPPSLVAQWNDYLQRYVRHYELTGEQQRKAEMLLQQHLAKLQEWLQKGTSEVTRDYAFATITPTLTTAARIKEYQAKLQELRDKINDWNLQFDKDVSKQRVGALRTDVTRLRTDLQKDLDAQQEKWIQELDKLRTNEQAEIDYLKSKTRLTKASQNRGYSGDQQAVAELIQAARDTKSINLPHEVWARAESHPEELIESCSRDPEYRKTLLRICKRLAGPPLKVEDTFMLDLADRTVSWSLTLAGLGLILGCFTRFCCIVGAALLLLFYLSLPPLPGLPDNAMAEGKYLFINKNLIEAIALMALATTASGRWFGIDGILSMFTPFKYLWPKPQLVQPVHTASV